VFSANEEGSYVHAHTIVLGAPPRADCRRVCAMNLRRRLYSHQPIAVNSLAHCRSNVLTSYESRTRTVPLQTAHGHGITRYPRGIIFAFADT